MSIRPSLEMVFISYSHDSPKLVSKVLEFSNLLRSEGVDSRIDQYIDNPPEGWPRWMDDQIDEAEFVLVISTKGYLEKMKDKNAEGKGKGVKWESMLAYTDLYKAEGKNEKFIAVVFDSADEKFIPKPIASNTYYQIPESYDKLLKRLLGGKHSVERPDLGVSIVDDDSSNTEAGGGVVTTTKNQDIDIIINDNYKNFTEAKKAAILAAIRDLLEADHEVNVKRKRKGSVILTLELKATEAEQLYWAIKAGALEDLNVVDAKLVDTVVTQRDKLTECIMFVLLTNNGEFVDFNTLFESVYNIRKEYKSWGAYKWSGGEEMVRLRVYEILQDLDRQRVILKEGKLYAAKNIE